MPKFTTTVPMDASTKLSYNDKGDYKVVETAPDFRHVCESHSADIANFGQQLKDMAVRSETAPTRPNRTDEVIMAEVADRKALTSQVPNMKSKAFNKCHGR
jgi:hypothetical protein